MLDLIYSLIIEATDDLTFFYFYPPDLQGFILFFFLFLHFFNSITIINLIYK